MKRASAGKTGRGYEVHILNPHSTMAARKTTKKETTEAQGMTTVSQAWNVRPSKVTAENIPKFQANIHYQDAVNNLKRQIYPAEPEVWVTDADGETDENLTQQARIDFARIAGYDNMQYVIPDVYGYGCSIFSPGISKIGNDFHVTEIRHLPPESFYRAPPEGGYNSIIPNMLTPGICINKNGEVELWQTNRQNNTQTKIENYRIIRDAGSAYPSGTAYMYPVYFLLSLIDFALQAEIQQVNRIGAPMLLMKISDEADESAAEAITAWGKQFLSTWGKNTAGVIPQGLEFPTYSITETTTAKEFVSQCVEWIRTYCNPMSDMTQTGNLGASDTGRMEMWANFIAAEQNIAERWIEDLFDWCLTANGYEGYHTHIQLRRPSIDRSTVKLQYITQAVNSKAITTEEVRDNMTDVLDLKDWSDELALDLKNQYPAATAVSLFGNTIDGFTDREAKIMLKADAEMETANDATYEAIKRIMRYT